MEYWYRCPVCGHKQTHSHSIKVDPEIRCDRRAGGARCGAVMKRVITGGSTVIFPMSTRSYIK